MAISISCFCYFYLMNTWTFIFIFLSDRHSFLYLLDELLQILLFSCSHWAPHLWCFHSTFWLLLLSVGSWRSGRCDVDWCPVCAGFLLLVLTFLRDWAGRPGGVPGGGGMTTAIVYFWLEEKLLSQEVRHLGRGGTFRQSYKIINAERSEIKG